MLFYNASFALHAGRIEKNKHLSYKQMGDLIFLILLEMVLLRKVFLPCGNYFVLFSDL